MRETMAQHRLSSPPSHWQRPYVADHEILWHWQHGLDSYDIAQRYFVHESEVYNRLGLILAAARLAG